MPPPIARFRPSRSLREERICPKTHPKHNVTVAIDAALLAKARVIAQRQRLSVSAMLAGWLRQLVDDDAGYLLARRRAMSHLQEPLELDEGEDIPEAATGQHDRT